jgi:hypothetical protein
MREIPNIELEIGGLVNTPYMVHISASSDHVPIILLEKITKRLGKFQGYTVDKYLIPRMKNEINDYLYSLVDSDHLYKIMDRWELELTDEEKTEFVLES